MATTFNLSVTQGLKFQRLLTFKNDDGSTRDLTGCSYRADFKSSYASSTVIGSFDFEVLDQATNEGKVLMTLPDTALNSLRLAEEKEYVCDIVEEYAGEIIKRISGKILVTPKVTT